MTPWVKFDVDFTSICVNTMGIVKQAQYAGDVPAMRHTPRPREPIAFPASRGLALCFRHRRKCWLVEAIPDNKPYLSTGVIALSCVKDREII